MTIDIPYPEMNTYDTFSSHITHHPIKQKKNNCVYFVLADCGFCAEAVAEADLDEDEAEAEDEAEDEEAAADAEAAALLGAAAAGVLPLPLLFALLAAVAAAAPFPSSSSSSSSSESPDDTSSSQSSLLRDVGVRRRDNRWRGQSRQPQLTRATAPFWPERRPAPMPHACPCP